MNWDLEKVLRMGWIDVTMIMADMPYVDYKKKKGKDGDIDGGVEVRKPKTKEEVIDVLKNGLFG